MTRITRRAFVAKSLPYLTALLVALAILSLIFGATARAQPGPTHNPGGAPAYDSGVDKLRITGDALIAGASVTTPAGTTAYTAGDLIANSATAGSVIPLQFTVCRQNQGTGSILRARIKTTETGQAGKIVNLKLYRSDPSASTGISNGDNAAWLTKEADYIGEFAVTLDQHFSDFEKGVAAPTIGTLVTFDCGSGSTIIYGLLVQGAGGSATLGGAKTYTAVLEAVVN